MPNFLQIFISFLYNFYFENVIGNDPFSDFRNEC